MQGQAITNLSRDTRTERTWNFRDDNHQYFLGTIPFEQREITLTLNWKPEAGATAREVGKFKINLPKLEAAGYIRKSARGYVLRFQRSGDMIVIARTRGGPEYPVGKKPK